MFHYDPAEFKGVPRALFCKAMNAEGIPCSSGYVPLYKEEFMQPDPEEYPWLEGRDYAGMCLPACERACYEEGCWMYQSTLLAEQEDMDQIADAVMKIRENLPELKKAAAEE